MLRRLHKEMVEESHTPMGGKKSKRQRILQLFKWKKQKPQRPDVPAPVAVDKTNPQKSSHESEPAERTVLEQSSNADETTKTPPQAQIREATPPAPEPEKKEEEKVTTLSEAQLHTLFAGAPHFGVAEIDGRLVPTANYPWDTENTAQDVSDSIPPVEPAFLATTLHRQPSKTTQLSEKGTKHQTYALDVFERPSMISAQGIEPGSIGMSHFLELPKADSLATDLEQSQSSKDFLEATRNKELMQSNPERIGIRPVEAELISDRLIELQDLYEAFQDSPGPMTILNNQSSGDLYANLFSKFLTPPGPDGTDDDPTGLQVQIMALLKILRLKGVWYDFSLVEWRIRLGQILWSDPMPELEHEPLPQWTEREILLLQITLACELLLRLDAITVKNGDHSEDQPLDAPDDIRGFSRMKTKKVDWDLVLARTFLENILVVKGGLLEPSTPQPKSRALLSLFSAGAEQELSKSDIVLLPQHQARQLSGLARFAETLHWPNIDLLSKEIAQKLGIYESLEQSEQQPTSSSRFLEATTPSSISIYGTPLQTPRSARDSYFGHLGKPTLNRSDSRSLRVPLSPSSISSKDQPIPVLNAIGGWLSRSCLTGLVLPGEAMSHFLMSTLLENDKLAIANLGESANLYGGFTWTDRTWWSKNSIVGRVLACVEGSAECMGWISSPKLPEDLRDQWHSIQSEQLPYQNRLRNKSTSTLVALDSAVIPGSNFSSIKPEDFVLPSDPDLLSKPSVTTQWELTPLNTDLLDTDTLSDPPAEHDIHVASVTITVPSQGVVHTISLAYDVQFVTSWPCTPPASALTSVTSIPHILTSSLSGTLSRSSSKRSETLSRRNSHGFEPLLSHPPDSTDIAPQRSYTPDPEEDLGTPLPKSRPMNAHPLHRSYLYRIVPVMEGLNPNFVVPFASHTRGSATRSSSLSRKRELENSAALQYKQTVLVLDARSSSDLELLARAWCAEKGYHAIISRVNRTCLACCIREARGLGINIVIRV